MRFTSVLYLGAALIAQSLAAPILFERDVTRLDAQSISSYSFYANFVAAAYCSGVANWSCKACKRIPGFVPYANGGNGKAIPNWYVGWWPAGSSVVVAHEGTDPLQFQSLLIDAKFPLTPLSKTLFPNVSSNVLVHTGFRDAHAASASQILAAVNKVIAERGATKVTVVGHSLGGAIASLDSLFLRLNLPSSIAIKGVTYGQPRVGNPDFANWIDATIKDFSRITNMDDPVPILPGRFLGYRHASGEKHINAPGVWNACSGQDNTSPDCSTGAVPNIIESNLIHHLGPYEGVWLGSDPNSDEQSPECPPENPIGEPPALFVVGKSSLNPPSKRPAWARHHINHSTPKSNSRPPRHGSSSSKMAVPVPRSVPLAFPAGSSFVFTAIDPASKLLASARGKAPSRTIQILPTDVLTTVVQSLEFKYHRQLLVSLSLVSQALNVAVAPLLYRTFRLPSFPDVYQFSLGPRYPMCISSLEMSLSPDPQRRNWIPPNSDWTKGLALTLRKLERLISFGIKRGGNNSALNFLVELGRDPSFLPALQKLSLGSWHQLSSFCPSRPITSYDLVFNLHEMQKYQKLEQLLSDLSTSDETIRELKITFDISQFGETLPMRDYHKNVFNLIGKFTPGLRVLKLRFQSRHSVVDKSFDLVGLVKQIPVLDQLVFLELFDSEFPQFASQNTVSAAAMLVQPGGSCPNLQFVNFDGLLWKHTKHPASLRLPWPNSNLQLRLASLSLEGGKVDQTQPEMSAPLMAWTPSPSTKRGRYWWESRVTKLHASSHAQAVNLLWQWMAEHWGKEYMADISSLERTVTRW